MKKLISSGLLLLSFTLCADTSSDEVLACETIKHLVPTEAGIGMFKRSGYGISTQECLDVFEFEIRQDEGESSHKEILMFGGTVEDLGTFCTVELLDNKVRSFSCELG